MRNIENNLLDIKKFKTKSICNDGRKVPENLDLDKIAQLNIYKSKESLNLNNTLIFTYNPFKIHPITTRSIIESINTEEFKNLKYKYLKNSYYYFPRIFDQTGLELDPNNEYKQIDTKIIIFDMSLNLEDEYYFQYNINYQDKDNTYFIKSTLNDFIYHLDTKQDTKIFRGNLEQKIRF